MSRRWNKRMFRQRPKVFDLQQCCYLWMFFICFDGGRHFLIGSEQDKGCHAGFVVALTSKGPASRRRPSLSYDERNIYYGYEYDRESVEQTMNNLMGVVANIQNPDLYSPAWADACEFDGENGWLKTSREIEDDGEILSLYPMDAIGFVDPNNDKDDGFGFITQTKIVGDVSNALRLPLCLLSEESFPYPMFHNRRHDLFILTDIQEPRFPGWLGHLAEPPFENDHEPPNCVILPLPGAAPLCALVSTRPISQHQRLVLSLEPLQNQLNDEFSFHLLHTMSLLYAPEIAELQKYTDMAYIYPSRLYLPSSSSSSDLPSKHHFKFPFYYLKMNHAYPNIHLLHQDPHILTVAEFLSPEECDSLIQMARPRLVPCMIRNTDTGEVQIDPNRSSTNANIPRRSIPNIVNKLMDLTNCPDERYFETFQVLRYENGQLFEPHRDGFPGPTTACGFHQSGRLVTIFVYLNTLLPHQGGQTRFTKLTISDDVNNVSHTPQPLDVTPEQGKAVIHFPNTMGLEEDVRTSHAGLPPILDTPKNEDTLVEKWLFVTWVWKNFRSDEIYSEENIED